MSARDPDEQRYADEQLILRAMRAIPDGELWAMYRDFEKHIAAMERPNNYQYLDESYAYAKLRRDDCRAELRRRNLA